MIQAYRSSLNGHWVGVLLWLGGTWALGGCSDDSKGTSDDKEVDAGHSQDPLCNAGTLEADLDGDPFAGPGVDPATGALQLAPGTTYVVSSTYGRPVPGADGAPVTERYLQLFGAIQEQLAHQPGLLAMRLASSEACGSGRTLAVWSSEDEMYDFVTSPAHLDAMRAVKEVLQPGYGVTHWSAHELAKISWEEAAIKLRSKP